MCGISGIVTIGDGRIGDNRRPDVDRMVAALGHRGPDGPGIAGDQYATMGVARLAIRGLTDGQQPIVDPETGVMAVCNGELDNHRELRSWLAQRGRTVRQATDVAVLPGLYLELGERFAERLVGAFAIAIWDPRSRMLFMARDRAGERPLYYRQSNGFLTFASELAALLPVDNGHAELDQGGIQHFLRFGYFGGTQTPYSEIRRVRPAEVVAVGPQGVAEQRYWRWSPATTAKTAPSADAFDEVFRAAVKAQGDVDVEHGVFLSGGVDSSLVAAVAASLHPEKTIKAYTLSFDEQSYDEGNFAQAVSKSLGLQSVTVPVRAEAVAETLTDLIQHCGEPLADPAWIPNAMLARRASEDIRIALGGEGADELFGGYPTYTGALVANHYRKLPKGIRSVIKHAVERWPTSDKKVALSFLMKRFVEAAELDGMSRHRFWVSNIPPTTLGRLGVDMTNGATAHNGSAADLLDRVQQHDFETSLAEGLLTKADRAGMRWGVESRAPFLDVAVMDFAAGLRTQDRAKGATTKVFLKRFAERCLPERVVCRRQRGRWAPRNVWLKGPLHAWARERVTSPRLGDVGIDTAVAEGLLQEHCARGADHARALWTLIVLSEWLAWDAGRIGGTPS